MSDSTQTEDQLPAVPEEPIANPGLPEHHWRPTDVDPKAEKRAERQVASFFAASSVFTILFGISYFTLDIKDNWDTFGGLGASNLALGLCLGLALLCIGIGIIQWARKLISDKELVEYRHSAASPEEDRAATLQALQDGLEDSGIHRRPLVRNSLLGAVSLVPLAGVIMLRDLGPLPGDVDDPETGAGLKHTLFGTADKVRIVRDVVGTPIRPADLAIGDLVNAIPDGLLDLHGVDQQVAKSKGAVIMVKMEPTEMKSGQNWSVDGVLCFSKICTHVGCPISLYERTTHHVLCPCHQSTFDLADRAKVIFGPAARPLPQLPLTLDEDGYLCADGDFREPVGPSYWERKR